VLFAVAAIALVGALVFLLTTGSSPVEKAVAERLGVSDSSVSCASSGNDVLTEQFYCEADREGGLTACFIAYVDPETGVFTEAGLFNAGAATDGCDAVFRQL
jgi:hypothetical protein